VGEEPVVNRLNENTKGEEPLSQKPRQRRRRGVNLRPACREASKGGIEKQTERKEFLGKRKIPPAIRG